MRCFYCARTGMSASEEHIPCAFLGSRLKTRRVCRDCNERAGREIDDRLAAYQMVQMPKALADVRNVRRQGREPCLKVDGIRSGSGERVRVRFTPQGRQARRPNGEIVHGAIETKYGLDSNLWVRFIAKVALGCAAQLFPEEWLDWPIARALRDLLWRGPIDKAIWPDGISGWPGELELEHPARQALGGGRHLVGLIADEADATSAVVIALLFGGQIACSLPLPAVAVPGSGPVWVLDWRSRAVPQQEDYEAAIERLLAGRGWSPEKSTRSRLMSRGI
jgi:HNH endonuclease